MTPTTTRRWWVLSPRQTVAALAGLVVVILVVVGFAGLHHLLDVACGIGLGWALAEVYHAEELGR